MRRGIRSLAIIGGLLVAGIAVASAPSLDRVVGPFELDGAVGDTISARLYSATLNEVGLAKKLDLGYADGGFSYTPSEVSSKEVFVVVDLRVTTEFDRVLLGYSQLVIDGVEYRAAPFLPGRTMLSPPGGPGIPVEGTLVFEVPSSVVESDAAAHARLHIKSQLTPQLESVPVFTIDLTGLDVERVRVLEPAEIPEDIR
ncbi:hypothetical protein EYE40_03945 [Glaciihabitans arcticus]|uniref:DUF4352 domain-containing protein n=1 Tax=Glaciihabitans arcticus TaxID=2668039 RepID=A0A4Q9GPS2_9MICO|nr:hypothetical protein [Glaciihabitans arcticus]TBN56615.1 hypothetical protein EYE40_03945 [Glaciihabitans arcticus]